MFVATYDVNINTYMYFCIFIDDKVGTILRKIFSCFAVTILGDCYGPRMRGGNVFVVVVCLCPMADPGGAPTPNGTQFLRFCTCFRRKLAASDIGATQRGWRPSP